MLYILSLLYKNIIFNFIFRVKLSFLYRKYDIYLLQRTNRERTKIYIFNIVELTFSENVLK